MPEEFKLKSEDIEPPKKNRKKIIIIAASVVAVVILATLGYYLWKNYESKKTQLEELKGQMEELQRESSELNTQIEETQSEEPPVQEEEEDAYSGWNTYANSEIGYQLRYPSDWTVKETSQWSELTWQDVKYITIDSPGKKYFLYWGLKEKDDEFSISERTGIGAGDFAEEGKITILGTEVVVKKQVYKNKAKEYFFPGIGSQKTADGKYYFGAALSYGDGSDYDKTDLTGAPELEKAKLILSSVKIIQRAAGTGCASELTSSDKQSIKNWKTFKNGKYDYSLKYPQDWSYDKVSDKLINFTGPDNLVFSWRSEEMTALGFEGWEISAPAKNAKVACQSAKSTYLHQGDERMIFTQFSKNGKNHMTNFGYRYVGASISSDMVEMYDLILKGVEFE